METYQALYVNEIRALEITINDQAGAPFEPSEGYVEVQDSSGNIVVAETAASISSNTAGAIIGTAVTATAGNYKVLWRLVKSSYTYYHVTELEITTL